MSAPPLKVLITGGGIAGSCLAYWLARSGLNVSATVLERLPVPRVTGQSIDIHGPAIEIVKQMRLEEAIRSRHTTETGTSILSSSGKALALFKTGDTFTAQYEILRADLCELFLNASQGFGNTQYIYGDSVKHLDQTEKKVNVTYHGGSQDSFDLVVAADGASSKTRPMILDDTILKDSYHALGQYIAFFSIPRKPTDTKLWQWYNTTKGLGIMTRPHPNTRTMGAYLCITLPARGQRDPVVEAAMSKGTAETKQMLHKYFDEAGWEAKRVLEGMDHAEDFYMTRAAQVKLPKWTNGRALVIGDAAFATYGVGTTLAIESAYYLAGELSKIQGPDDVPQALERYEREFRTLYSKMEDIPSWFPQVAFPQTSWGLLLRNSALWLASKTKAHKLLPKDAGVQAKLPCYDWVSV